MPKKTVALIVASGNHYLLAVKKNQKRLWEAIETVHQRDTPVSVYVQKERNRGRLEERKVSVLEVKEAQRKQDWQGLQYYIVVERFRAGSQEKAYYISDWTKPDAFFFYQASRGHWGIENSLHYVKDVVYQEDKNKIRRGSGAVFASIASTVAINISRKEQVPSISYSQIFFRADVKKTLNLIRT